MKHGETLEALRCRVEIFVARQPIFDRNQKVYGYELLFRQGFNQVIRALSGDLATSVVLTTSFSLIGMDNLTCGKRAFINFTRNLLQRQIATAFPRDILTVEILEDIEPDKATLEACANLRRAGYMLVLDDFIYTPKYKPFIEVADIIKVDFLTTPVEERRRLPREIGHSGLHFLAEKVETPDDLQMALDFGYSYIQGFFFSKPETISTQDIPGYKLNYLHILYEINQPQINFEALEQIILREVSIAYKLLRFINSAYFNLRHNIKSVRHALTMLGSEEIRKWASLVALSGMGDDKPDELAVLCATRGKFCELLGVHAGLEENRTDLYLMGLFSLVDAFTDLPLNEVLHKLPLHEQVNRALRHEGGRFSHIYDLVLAYETANWSLVLKHAQNLGLSESTVPALYQKAVAWANQVFYTEELVKA